MKYNEIYIVCMEVKGRCKDINDCIWKLNSSMVMDDDVFVFYDLKN
jgi:hypothetical protein